MNILDPAGSIHDAATPACIQQSQPNPDQSRVSSFRLSIHFFKLLIYFNNIIWFDLEQVQRSSISRLRDVSFAGTPPPSPIRQLRARHCLTKGQWELVLQCNSVGSNTIVRLRSPRRRRRSIHYGEENQRGRPSCVKLPLCVRYHPWFVEPQPPIKEKRSKRPIKK
jgi:hypothetical protein